MKYCQSCKKELSIGREIGRRDECPHCHADLHSCLNCGFYDPSAPKQCREPVAELVRDKARANFCDHFRFKDWPGAPTDTTAAGRDRKALDDLFRK